MAPHMPLLVFSYLIFISFNYSNATALESEPIAIAAIFSQTGIAAQHNAPLIEMTQLAVDEVNAQGGVLGRQIKLHVIDNQSTPIGATLAARQAVAMGVTAVIGAHWSSHSLAMAPVLQKAQIPMISPGSTNPEVTIGKDYIFRVCFIDSFQGKAMARFAYEELNSRRAAVLSNIDEQYSVMLADFFRQHYTLIGGKVVLDEGYRGNANDFSDIIEKLRKTAVDIIYIPGYSRDSGLFIKQATRAGITATFLGGDGWDAIETFAGEALEGSYQSAPWHPEVPFARSAALRQLYEDVRGKPLDNMSSPLAYDAVMLLVEAIRTAGVTDRTKIRNSLASLKGFEGATGHIAFDSQGDPKNKEIIIIKFTKGKRVFARAIHP